MENQEWSRLDIVLQGHQSRHGKSLLCQNLLRNYRDNYVVIPSASCFTAMNRNVGQHIKLRMENNTCLYN